LADNRFFASEVSWQDDALCNGAPFDFTPDIETVQGAQAARSLWCNLCPVRVECLAYALLYHQSGYWGGTTTAERRRLGAPRNRVKCPSCKSRAVIPTPEGHEICQHCAVSWTGSHLPREATG
jgi:hypothetical protein